MAEPGEHPCTVASFGPDDRIHFVGFINNIFYAA